MPCALSTSCADGYIGLPFPPQISSAGGRRSYIKFICYAEFFYHVLEDKLRDGGTADIAMADEHYFYHSLISFQKARIFKVFGHKYNFIQLRFSQPKPA